MIDTFNYEYWAHRTHRLITEPLINQFSHSIVQNADNYFHQVALFQKEILRSDPSLQVDAEKIGIYLSCIYLWPLHILLHPTSPEMNLIGTFMERIQITLAADRMVDANRLVCLSDYLDKPCLTPLQNGIMATLKELDLLPNSPHHPLRPFSKYELIRLKTDLVVQRGMYEGWYHDHPVLFQNSIDSSKREVIQPLEVMSRFLDILKPTMKKLSHHPLREKPYDLYGIVPATR